MCLFPWPWTHNPCVCSNMYACVCGVSLSLPISSYTLHLIKKRCVAAAPIRIRNERQKWWRKFVLQHDEKHTEWERNWRRNQNRKTDGFAVSSDESCWNRVCGFTHIVTEIYFIIVVAVVLVCLYVWQDDGWKLTQNWHLANCEQGTNHRQLKRHLASITVELVFGLTTAEQVDTGQFSSSTCSCPKWNTDESVENSFDCICNSYVCVWKRRCVRVCAVHEFTLHTGARTRVPAWTTRNTWHSVASVHTEHIWNHVYVRYSSQHNKPSHRF